MQIGDKSRFGVVAIGRNEGDRLKQCLLGLRGAQTVVYVDSGSTDGSVSWARSLGIDVVELDMSFPFTAARARNAGFRYLRKIAPGLGYAQFIDGDCELRPSWPAIAVKFLDEHGDASAVFGRVRERHPDRSIYNRLCDREWSGPIGEVRACGGIFMMRMIAMEEVDGFRDDLIAGEEPELCLRLRRKGWRIWRLDHEMTLHDAGMTRFKQWWLRAIRFGYASAQGAYLHGTGPERYRIWESFRTWLWALIIPCLCAIAVFMFGHLGFIIALIYPVQMLRLTLRNRGPIKDRAILAFFHTLARFPEILGQLKFLRDLLLKRKTRIIEYK
jgi:GT2 family glycosyltransferase